MILERLDLTLPGGIGALLVFTGRGLPEGGGGGARPGRYDLANLGSHVGDDPGRVRANRAELARLLGVAPSEAAVMRPDHGRGVAVVREPGGIEPEAEVPDVDALITDRPGVALVALAADCAPVLLAGRRAVAAVHSGWRGLLVDVVGAAVERLRDLDRGPFQAVIGPAICGGCYAVPPERAELVAGVRPEAVARARDGQPSIDLRGGLRARLTELGVQARVMGGCTFEEAALFSHRRLAPTGRQAGAVVMSGGRR